MNKTTEMSFEKRKVNRCFFLFHPKLDLYCCGDSDILTNIIS